MNYSTWHKYFEEDPQENVGRYIEGIFSERVLVVMPRIYWAYLDWMESELKGDIVGFFKKCEAVRTPEHGHIGQAYQNAVYCNMMTREKKGLKRPDWLNAASKQEIQHFDDFMKENS